MVSLGNLWSFLKEHKPLVMFEGDHGVALEPMQGNQASSGVNLGYMELIRVAACDLRVPLDL